VLVTRLPGSAIMHYMWSKGRGNLGWFWPWPSPGFCCYVDLKARLSQRRKAFSFYGVSAGHEHDGIRAGLRTMDALFLAFGIYLPALWSCYGPARGGSVDRALAAGAIVAVVSCWR